MKPHLIALSCLLSIPLLGIVYIYLNRSRGASTHSLLTDLDEQTPFLKIFIVPYLVWFVFILVCFVYLAFKNRQLYMKTLLLYNIGLVICYCIYAVYQTHVPRPEVSGTDWLSRLVQYVYNSDQPYNCFPSTHVLTSYCIMKAFASAREISRPIRLSVSTISILIILSTLFVKQYVLLDIAGAIAVVEASYFIADRVKMRNRRPAVIQELGNKRFLRMDQ
ncbi:phosphatase PAP2 family protein [Paenibacillus sp. sptzw28]|uniref:phosphatase PAP2 family protein n=1 Tax=Paenibacillus sp. sptzw28 TaxID=715179 RepID=UPI001C6E0215|nr:phosphatase PAP2 family protein [Paenibacillus sp. sptzw28]QYR19105.1 phosphatase PAP2 family protein [Paenibacillus sp. sptzw28]